jgi:S1-C subfamily serine protease
MRRFHSFLLAAGLVAGPAGALANPSDEFSRDPSSTFEKLESTSKGRLGVVVMSLSPELRKYFGSPDESGVLVARVEPGSLAARAGITVGDVIINVRDTKVDDAGDVRAALNTTADRIKVRVLRDKKPLELDVSLGNTMQSTLDFAPLKWLEDLLEDSKGPPSA